MAFSTIIYEKRGNAAWIIFNRPEVLNSQDSMLLCELNEALKLANLDEDVHVLVVTGAGHKAFSAGGDLNEIADFCTIDYFKRYMGTKRPYELIREITKPIIAMVNGAALGGGCEIAMACDIIIASENAQFGQPEIGVGVIPGGGGTQVLPRVIGEKRAKEMIFTGKLISAEEAFRIGMINLVVPPERLLETVQEFVLRLQEKSPIILSLAKIAINRSLETPLSSGMACEMEMFAMCLGTEDQKEGTRAFLEKRKPSYRGR